MTTDRPAETTSKPGKGAESRARGKEAAKLARELDRLPEKIDAVTAAIATLEDRLADPHLHVQDPGKAEHLVADLATRQATLAELEERWLELETMREAGELS